ncbi:helix-turn-helix domain-containing protein [[Clostridium] symbiosum]|uniref:helix-turn-helix domain-containing protein n=1 Tax=Clostridium symbiosum TaxID=1512 RepID=UPI001D07CB51|nr:helix-turn-helix domain-containing protein [[Clostridium] symbiosum]MCB6611095.1 helix-turn-helix domain-containing protein [[Clostridium] symbiosum]MCB6933258.1 helix-turn-helix domain-containing protein [[Clostridium] symbiosum]
MISYEPLFRTMKEKNITAYQLNKMGFSNTTYHSIKRGNGITMKTLNTLCELLDCDITDVVEYVTEQK